MVQNLFIIVLVILIAGFGLENILDFLNHRTWSAARPDSLKDFYDEDSYKKAVSYHSALYYHSFIKGLLMFLIIIFIFSTRGFGLLGEWVKCFIPSNKILQALTFYGIIFIVTEFVNIPFSVHHIFVIEEKFGFNKTTAKTFIFDKLKSYLLVIILGGGLISLLIWLILILGNNFWIVAFFAVLVISLFLNVFYGTLIIPLFNKLKPLDKGELRTIIEEFAKNVKFPLTNIYLIDGSKRSSKANAFFTGLWKKKKIVLYDTLIEKHTNAELVAVLAHEVGHYKKKHIVINMIISAIEMFIMFYIMKLFIFNLDLSKAFGSHQLFIPVNLIAFAILYEPVTLVLGLAGNIISRHQEYEADGFAVKYTGRDNLAVALKKLSTDQLSNLLPHPAYVFFYYSHPPVIKRLEAMRECVIV